jgi:hypothetical protein
VLLAVRFVRFVRFVRLMSRAGRTCAHEVAAFALLLGVDEPECMAGVRVAELQAADSVPVMQLQLQIVTMLE